ncbi:MAG: metal ABC transporter ATP-binding protein [Peptococcia bacterium]
MNKVVIKLNNVTFAYPGGQPVLRNINLEVKQGDYMVILGANGSAKTTLLKIMLGLLKPQQGSLELPGPAKGQAIAYIPQKASGINPGFPATVEEIVNLNIPSHSKDRKQLVKNALEMVGLWEKRKQLLGTLSGGQMQKVMIARSIVVSPVVLFLDEPNTGLDAASQSEFMDLIRRLNENGLTVVMVTHNLEQVAKQANRFLYLHNGQLKESD